MKKSPCFVFGRLFGVRFFFLVFFMTSLSARFAHAQSLSGITFSNGAGGNTGFIFNTGQSFASVTVGGLVTGAMSSLSSNYETVTSGVWSNPNTWAGSNVPPVGAIVSIKTGHTVTLNTNITLSKLIIENGASLNLVNQTVNISAGGEISRMPGSNITIGLSTVKLLGNATVSNMPFFNLEANGAVTFADLNSSVSNQFKLMPGGAVSSSNTLAYLSGSTLVYQTGLSQTVGNEWKPGTGQGSPHHVTLHAVALTIPGGNYYIKGNFESTGSISSTSLSLQASTNLYVAGSLNLLNASVATGSSKFIFNGSTDQLCSLNQQIHHLDINKSSGALKLGFKLTLSGNLNFLAGNLDLNGNDLELLSNGNIVNETNTNRVVNTQPTSGKIFTDRNFTGNTINSSNNGGIGLEVTALSPIGQIILQRHVKSIAGLGASNGIGRVYGMYSQQPLAATFNLLYLPAESSGIISPLNIFYTTLNDPDLAGNYSPITQVSTGPQNISNVSPLELNSTWLFLSVGTQNPSFSGNLNFPSTDYPNLETLIDCINASGVGPGGLNINISSNIDTINLENPIIIDIQNNSPGPANPLVISGNPLNPPVIRAPRGGTLDRDAVLYIIGNDFITLQNISLFDPPSNDDNYERMEWGIAILKRSNTNACQNVVLRNWNIRLQIEDTVSTGIYIGNHGFDPTQSFVVANSFGCHSSLVFQKNTISRVNKGIMLKGYSDPNGILFDNNILLGDSINASNGNTIFAFGGVNYPAYGIRIINAGSVFVHQNIIRNSISNTLPAISEIRGISLEGQGRTFASVRRNYIQLTQGTTSQPLVGIHTSLLTSRLQRIENNRLLGFANAAGSASVAGIRSLGNITGRLLISGNSFSQSTFLSQGNFYGIQNETTARVYISNDTISQINTQSAGEVIGILNRTSTDSIFIQSNIFANIQKNGLAGSFFGYLNQTNQGSLGQNPTGFSVLMSATSLEQVSSNILSNIQVSGNTNFTGISLGTDNLLAKSCNANILSNLTSAGGIFKGISSIGGSSLLLSSNRINNVIVQGEFYGLYCSGSPSLVIAHDSILQITQGASQSVYGLYHHSVNAAGADHVYRNNFFSTFQKNGSGIGNMYGMYLSADGLSSGNVRITGNTITRFTQSGLQDLFGIYYAQEAGSGNTNFALLENTIDDLRANGTNNRVTGIFNSHAVSSGSHIVQADQNLIHELFGSGEVNGIYHYTGGTGGIIEIQTDSNRIDSITGSPAYGIYHYTGGTGGIIQSSSDDNVLSTLSGPGDVYGI
ncbi:MAG: hypothetical protein ACK5D8_02420, partial [Bacteroidota bacterium]